VRQLVLAPVMISLAVVLIALLVAFGAQAQQDHSHHGDVLGTVHFPTTCAKEVGDTFTRGVALLHSFGYDEARRAFEAVAAKDPRCGMAYWGIAMTQYHPVWAPPTDPELSVGQGAAQKASAIGASTPRERAYIEAINVFYEDATPATHQARARAYRDRMEKLAREFPDDAEASVFYSLALLATAAPGDATLANQKRSAAILNRILKSQPDHPGIVHYLIHSFDYPSLAREALPAARAYAKIAPSSPHALHMPSHIFTRLGLWEESIASNIDSARSARERVEKTHPGAASFDALHALDYLVYAYLQVDDQVKARAAADEAEAARRFDEPSFAAGYAIAAIPARWTLERRDWNGAAALDVPTVNLPWRQFPYAMAITHFAKAVGAARSGQLDRARLAVEALRDVRQQLAASPVAGPYDWTGQVESMRLAASAWIAHSEGRSGEAIEQARAAAELEEKVGKHPVTPGPVLSARELLGELLLELGRPDEALAAFEASLAESPNRFNSLAGAARAAVRAGNRDKSREYYQKLVAQAGDQSQRPELPEARAFLGRS